MANNILKMLAASKAKRTKLESGALVIQVTSNVVDVFPPTLGFGTPTRYRKRGGEWVYQQGPKVPVPKGLEL